MANLPFTPERGEALCTTIATYGMDDWHALEVLCRAELSHGIDGASNAHAIMHGQLGTSAEQFLRAPGMELQEWYV